MSGEMDKRRIPVHVGAAEDLGRRLIDAWRRAKRGARVREEHLTVVDFKAMRTRSRFIAFRNAHSAPNL